MIKHCEDMGDRFAILDGVQDTDPLKADGPLLTQRGGLLSKSGFGGALLAVDPDPRPDRTGDSRPRSPCRRRGTSPA